MKRILCVCARVRISCSDIWKQWAVQHNECVIWQSKKTTLGKKEVRGEKNSPAGFPRTQTPSFLHSLRVCQCVPPRLPCHNQKPSMTDPQGITHSALHTQTHTHTTTGGMILLNLYCDVRIRKGYGNTFLSAQSFKYFPPFIFSSAIRHAPSIHREILTNASWAGDES